MLSSSDLKIHLEAPGAVCQHAATVAAAAAVVGLFLPLPLLLTPPLLWCIFHSCGMNALKGFAKGPHEADALLQLPCT